MNQEIAFAVVRIYKQNGDIAGTGFLIDRYRIMTCAHVVNLALDRPLNSPHIPEDAILFEFPLIRDSKMLNATVVPEYGWHPRQQDGRGDIAILLIGDETALPDVVQPVLLLVPEQVWGHEFHVIGFTKTIGIWASGHLRDFTAPGWLQLEDIKEPGYRIQSGFSGSPVWDATLNGVVGMIAVADTDPQPKTAFALPAQELFQAWPLLKYQQGENLRQRWLEWEGTKRSQLITERLKRYEGVGSISSPLHKEWRTFINEPAWHISIANEVNHLHELSEKLSEFEKIELHTLSQTINFSGTCEEVVANLHTIIKPEVFHQVRKLIRKLEPLSEEGSYYEDMFQTAIALQGKINELRNEITLPVFKRCFPVLGSWGSGKTYFLVSLLHNPVPQQSEVEKNYLVLPLSPPNNADSLQGIILSKIREITRVNWANLESFDAYLQITWAPPKNSWLLNHLLTGNPSETPAVSRLLNEIRRKGMLHTPPRLVIAIDDLQDWLQQRPSMRTKLIQSIKELTALKSFYWIILLQDTEYITAATHTDRFWSQYSHLPRMDRSDSPPDVIHEESLANFGGWLVLDVLNRQTKLGIQIIKNQLLDSGNTPILLDSLKEDDPVLFHISSPFIAWILLELRNTLPLERLVTLSFIEFVDRFWEKRRHEIAHPLFTPTELTQAIYLVTRGLLHAESRDLQPKKNELINFVTTLAAEMQSTFAKEAQTKLALEVLQRANLIQEYEKPNPNEPDWVEIHVRLRFEPFWELNFARYLRNSSAIKSQDIIKLKQVWQEQLEKNQQFHLEEGVLEFLLLLLDLTDNNHSPTPWAFKKKAWLLALQDNDLPSEAVWFAGSKASLDAQKIISTWALHLRELSLKDRSLFAYVHFLGHAQPEVLGVSARLKLMNPHFQALREADLSLYFFHIMQHLIISTGDPKIILDCMKNLSGSDVLGIADDLARLIVQKIASLFQHKTASEQAEQLLTIILAYLNYEDRRLHNNPRNNPIPWRRTYFDEWVIREFCRHIVEKLGLTESLNFLLESGWYTPQKFGLGKEISLDMEREANIVIGFAYRTKFDNDEREAFFDALNDLLKERDLSQWELCLHLIRHTRPTEEREEIRIEERFLPLLKRLYIEPKMAKFVSYHEKEIFVPNFGQIELNALQKKRQRVQQARDNVHGARKIRRSPEKRNRRKRR